MASYEGNHSSQYPGLGTTSSILIQTVQQLSLAQSLKDIMSLVSSAARKLVHADGVTVVLREGERCYYADEEAIAPLWKGMRFSMQSCISGWCMINKVQVCIEDIYLDKRIPHDAYRPTFVKSLAMTPIRKVDPIGAVGTYWASKRIPTTEELDAIQALADATSIAIQNLEISKELEHRLQEIERTNHQLGRFTWIASHDLKEPLRSIGFNSSLLELQLGMAEEAGELLFKDVSIFKQTLDKIKVASEQSQHLVASLIDISNIGAHEISQQAVNLNSTLKNTLVILAPLINAKKAQVVYDNLPIVWGDPVLLARVFQAILSNALKFQNESVTPQIEIKSFLEDSMWKISIMDNGIGIAPQYHQKVFALFNRVHGKTDTSSRGVSLFLCKKIIENLGGRIELVSEQGKGSCFSFTIPRNIT